MGCDCWQLVSQKYSRWSLQSIAGRSQFPHESRRGFCRLVTCVLNIQKVCLKKAPWKRKSCHQIPLIGYSTCGIEQMWFSLQPLFILHPHFCFSFKQYPLLLVLLFVGTLQEGFGLAIYTYRFIWCQRKFRLQCQLILAHTDCFSSVITASGDSEVQ